MDFDTYLIATAGPLEGLETVIGSDGVTIGRDVDATITITEQGVSRQHAELTLHNAGIWVKDLGSRNGVYINEKRVVRPRQLAPGDELRVGKNKFVLKVRHDGAALNDDSGLYIAHPPSGVHRLDGSSPPPELDVGRRFHAWWVIALIVVLLAAASFLTMMGE